MELSTKKYTRGEEIIGSYYGKVLIRESRDGFAIWELANARAGESIFTEPTIGKQIAALRKALKQTQAGCAQLLGISVRTVEGWEIDRGTPRHAIRLLELLYSNPGLFVRLLDTKKIF